MIEYRNTKRVRLVHEPVIKATPFASLSLRTMPTDDHFQRDHFPVPEFDIEARQPKLTGISGRQLELSVNELARFPKTSLAVVLECAGDRRSDFKPTVEGIQWGLAAVSEVVWTGVRLSDILRLVEIRTATHGNGPSAQSQRRPNLGDTAPSPMLVRD